MNCRHCDSALEHVFLDLGFAPPSNAYVSLAALRAPEIYYPLKLYVCAQCWLVQTDDHAQSVCRRPTTDQDQLGYAE